MTLTAQEKRACVAAALGAYLVADKHYTTALPADLADWYCYTADGGHSICAVCTSQVKPGEPLADFLVPMPVKLVQRVGYTVDADGYIWCDAPYDADLGLIAAPDDDEW